MIILIVCLPPREGMNSIIFTSAKHFIKWHIRFFILLLLKTKDNSSGPNRSRAHSSKQEAGSRKPTLSW